ncbi:hypothetical protein DPEC_G00196160 [Dallia pectoralis]|uniref:Uncharacterized protein n=1 Tax=Dallia pectoralis TaxID=75939 RepID=A0ACC2G7P0_DALPE|nr:hypothetical protein DPEC_G00196160 [Dallia pectoralis]
MCYISNKENFLIFTSTGCSKVKYRGEFKVSDMIDEHSGVPPPSGLIALIRSAPHPTSNHVSRARRYYMLAPMEANLTDLQTMTPVLLTRDLTGQLPHR